MPTTAFLNRWFIPAAVAFALTVCPATPQRQLSEQQYRSGMKKGLSSVKSITEPQKHHPLQFAVNLFFAHEGVIEHVDLDVLTKMVDAFRDLGVDRVDINMGLFPWKSTDPAQIAKYDAVIRHIRDAGLQLAINPQYTAVRHRVASLEGWTAAALPVYEEIARRYKPEIFVTIHEPTTMNKRMGVEADAAAWRDFARAAAAAVKRVSPRTRCGAGGLDTEIEYFREFASLPELDVLTINIHGLAGLKTCNEMVKIARGAGKGVYIEETWRPAYYVRPKSQWWKRDTLETISGTGIGLRSYQDLDIEWLETITEYASVLGLEAVTPFWTQTFFAYVPEGGHAFRGDYNQHVMEAVRRGDRTETYHAVERLIQRYGAGKSNKRRR
jgi:hypothetical protein